MKDDNLFNFSSLILKLEDLNNQKEIKVLHANFMTEEITVEVINSADIVFKTIVDKVKFLEMSQKFIIKTVDFLTGNIVVSFINYNDNDFLSQKEINLVKNNQYIGAIKEIRTRRNIGLAAAKKIVDDYKIRFNL